MSVHFPLITHTRPFNGPFSGTTRVSRYQKGKTNLDFTEARDSEWQWHQLDHMQVCISLQTDNHASTPLLSFLQAGCPSCRPTNSVKALKALSTDQWVAIHSLWYGCTIEASLYFRMYVIVSLFWRNVTLVLQSTAKYLCWAFAGIVLAFNCDDLTAILLHQEVLHIPRLWSILEHQQHTITGHHIPADHITQVNS